MEKIGILGGGVWGSALAKLLSNNKICIYARDKQTVKSINDHRFNPKLKYAVFNENVTSTENTKTFNSPKYLFIALPSQTVREVLTNLSLTNEDQEIIIASKGIEISTSSLLSEVVNNTTRSKKISILSGPCFSDEVAQNLPTAATFASNNRESFRRVNSLIQNKNFRLYYSDDLVGCQVGGALKNIYAIAAGITQGLNLGENAKSALITRSFVEISRFGKALGAKQQTMFSLSGLGDLILTCNSLKSRNTSFGQVIATIAKPDFKDILKSQEITEGYYTVKAVKQISEEKKIDMPIMQSVYNILYNFHSIKDEIKNLLERPVADEFN